MLFIESRASPFLFFRFSSLEKKSGFFSVFFLKLFFDLSFFSLSQQSQWANSQMKVLVVACVCVGGWGWGG